MNLPSFSVLCFSFGVLLVAILTLVKRKDRIAIRFLLFSIAVCGWGFPEVFWFSQNYSIGVSWLLMKVSNAFAIWIPICWLHFVMEFVKRKEPIKHFHFYIYLIGFLLTSISFSSLFMEAPRSIGSFKYYTNPGIFYHVFTALFFILVPLGFAYLIGAYKVDGYRRKQLKSVIIATVFGFSAGSTTFLPVYGIPSSLIFLPLMTFYPIFMGIGLTRYGLFDIQQFADAAHRDKLAAIGTLATSINHEIRNPLYIIQGLSDSYLANIEEGIYKTDEERSKKSQEIFKKTSQQATRAMEIMKSFAMFAKQNVNDHFKIESININEVLSGILPLVNHELELEKIKLIREIPEQTYINADRRHLEEIFFNLIVNASQALKQNNEKTPQIRFRSELKDRFVRIEVSDNGPGISPGQLSKVFEPFYTTKEEGTGLGLYVTRQLVEKNRGKIEIESQLGRGTSFILSFPVTPIKENRT